MTKSLRVLQVSHDYQGPFKGVCRQYCDALSGAEVTTLYLRGCRDEVVAAATGGDHVLFLDLPKGSLRGLKIKAFMQVLAVLRDHEFNLVVAHRYKAMYLLGLASYFCRIPVLLGVVHDHDLLRRFTRRVFLKYVCPGLQLISISATVSEDLASRCPALLHQDRIHEVPNAIDSAIAAEMLSCQEARLTLKIPPGKFCFGIVGRLVGKKGHALLLRAYAQVANDNNCLIVIGDGPRMAGLVTLADSLGIKDRVIFSGNLIAAYRLFKAFDAFVMASDATEAFGVVLLEAMVAEIPIVSSDGPGPASAIAACALTFRESDEAELAKQLLAVQEMTPEAVRRMTDMARDRVEEKFSPRQFRENLMAIPSLLPLEASL